MINFSLDLSSFSSVNDLWPKLVDRLGLEKSQQAIRQALDIQRMNGDPNTLPVILFETCGLALVNVQSLRETGLSSQKKDMIIILSKKENILQIIHN
tara:strand:+ start:220 stop:510 length:291 start_codon:yes stop_codon:yes gene_type:complete